MPAAMATTKTITRGDSVARFSSAGPGHRPERPQPTPNSAEPITSGRSMSVLVGHELCAASSGRSRRFASAKPAPATTSAAAITTARLGSQAPKMSRKASTFAGCIIPEISRPQPKTNPEISAATISMAQPAST